MVHEFQQSGSLCAANRTGRPGLVVAQSSSEIPEGLTNNPVLRWENFHMRVHAEANSGLHCKDKGKGKDAFNRTTGHEGPYGEYRCSSTLSLTSALDGVSGQRHAPVAL